MEEISTAGLSPSPPFIRLMQPADVDRVLAIAAELPTAPHWSRQSYLDALDLSASSAPTRRVALVAEAEGVLLGFLIASLLLPEAELESIAVAPEAQQQGIGRLLLESAIANLRSAGAHRFFLEIRASNSPAAALYSRLKFHEIGRRPNYYSTPAEAAILMQLNLL